MALGKPIICTDADGIRDYVTPQTAIMLPNDVDSWQKAIERLYDNKEEYQKMSNAVLKLFSENFTDKVMFQKIARLLK